MRGSGLASAGLRAIPVLLLLLIAGRQQWLARERDLSPWLGGGFGMFSTLDALAARHLHAFLRTESVRMELPIPDSALELHDRALALPSEAHLRALAEALALDAPREPGGPHRRIEIQVFGRRYDPRTLHPEGVLLRALEVPAR